MKQNEKYENLKFMLQNTNWNPILLAWLFKNTRTYGDFENKKKKRPPENGIFESAKLVP